MTRAEAAAYNEGVLAVLDIAARTAAAIRATSQRPAEAFAVAALDELTEAGRDLLIDIDDGQPVSPSDARHNRDEPAAMVTSVGQAKGVAPRG